jgi:tyrosine-protein phosphatase SIW14
MLEDFDIKAQDKYLLNRFDFELSDNSSADIGLSSYLHEIKEIKDIIVTYLTSKKSNYLKFKISNNNSKNEVQKVIKNFQTVDNKYYRGAVPDSKGIEYLIECKQVKMIVDLRFVPAKKLEKYEKLVKESGLKYINIPMFPFWPPNIRQINLFLKIIANADNLPVYVHCREGKDRTGIMTAIYRVLKYNYNYEKAFIEMLKYGHHYRIFPLMRMWLYKYTMERSSYLPQMVN